MNIRPDFVRWLKLNDKYLTSNIDRYIDNFLQYIPDFNPFEISEDYSDALEIKLKMENELKRLRKLDDFKATDKRAENGSMSAIVGSENYLRFLQLQSTQFGRDSIDFFIKLKMSKDPINKFKITKWTQSWIWIADDKGVVGTKTCHYELLERSGALSVEIHFEGHDGQKVSDIVNQNLPNELTEIIHEKIRSIKYKDSFQYSDPLRIEKCIEAISLMEMKLGNLLREAVSFVQKNPTELNNESDNFNMSLNRILYGPPGTGKTYNSINHALNILKIKTPEYLPRTQIKEIFDAKIKSGQIVFTTFHQSLNYEDFIEGIKPIEPKKDGEQVSFQVVNGLFVNACALAGYYAYTELLKSRKIAKNYSFDDLYSAFIQHIVRQIRSGTPVIFTSIKGKPIEVKEINKRYSIIARSKDSVVEDSAPLTKENIQKLYDHFQSADEINGLKQIRDVIQIQPRNTEFYAIFKGLKDFEKGFLPDNEFELEADEINLEPAEIQEKFRNGVFDEAMKAKDLNPDGIVLIIDEINRGNVSQIFGELITLIEDDKRIGRPEAIEVTLPYSQKKFGVPPNLYIIGTMNTADRSVEALDTALRRRFSFIEMDPEPEKIRKNKSLQNGVLDGIDLVELLTTINNRIAALLDKDHLIGHSYFMSIQNMNDLKQAFANKILPLLQEYFYGDDGKIGLVLGTGFFSEPKVIKENIFAKFHQYDFDAERTIYTKVNVGKMSDADFIAALNTLMK
jgi:5-methylcytosine-specific restriction protein B